MNGIFWVLRTESLALLAFVEIVRVIDVARRETRVEHGHLLVQLLARDRQRVGNRLFAPDGAIPYARFAPAIEAVVGLMDAVTKSHDGKVQMITPRRVVFAEGEEDRMIGAANSFANSGLGHAIFDSSIVRVHQHASGVKKTVEIAVWDEAATGYRPKSTRGLIVKAARSSS